MFHNEKGFMYPLTLCFLLLFSMILIVSVEQFLTEKRMLIETENILKQDYYFFKTVQALEELLSSEGQMEFTGEFEMGETTVDYTVNEQTDTQWEISLTMNKGTDREIRGFAYYDKNIQKMVKWKEIR